MSDYGQECDDGNDVQNKKALQMRYLQGFQRFSNGRYWTRNFNQNIIRLTRLRQIHDTKYQSGRQALKLRSQKRRQ
jgi:hypothetical protein